MAKNNTVLSEEFKAAIDKYTKTEAYEKLQEVVTTLNEGVEDDKKLEYDAMCKELCKKYNELSLLTVYGACAKAEQPVLEFAQTYFYPTVSTKDKLCSDLDENGRKYSFVVRSIEEGEKRLDLYDFLNWAEDRNKQVTHSGWRTPCENTRKSIEDEWKKFFHSDAATSKISVNKIKEALQKMFNALVFIETPSGNNAIMARGSDARFLFGFANTLKDGRNKDKDINFNASCMSTKQWIFLTMVVLHHITDGKEYKPKELVITYGSDEAETGTKAEDLMFKELDALEAKLEKIAEA